MIGFDFGAVSEANKPSLVRGSKSSTEIFGPDYDFIPEEKKIIDITGEHEQLHPWDAISKAGKYVQIKHEEWSGHYTATAYIQDTRELKPPPQEGDRWTDALSQKAKKKIENSAKYLSKKRRGYRAFITLTFDNEARAQIELHNKYGAFHLGKNQHGPVIPLKLRESIGKKATKFLNALQQRRKNGMLVDIDGKDGKPTKAKIRGTHAPFEFIWVIENPWRVVHTPYGPGRKPNPHIHVLTNWTVKKKFFKGWAARIEKLWGKGFAHIERIRKPASAAAYMAKAANYIGKGADGSQGRVRGNRYSISKGGRAPLPRLLGNYALQFLRDAIRLGMEAGRNRWPKGIYFHPHGFGASCKEAWGKLWTALKGDGFTFQEQRDLLLERITQTTIAFLDKGRRDYLEWHEYRRYCDYIIKPLQQISLEEFEAIHAA